MLRRRISIIDSVNEQNRNADFRCSNNWAHRADLEMTLLFGDQKRSVDDVRSKEEGRAFGGHRTDIGEGFGGDHRCYPRVKRGFLQRHRGAERCADEHDRTTDDAVDHAMEVTLLEE